MNTTAYSKNQFDSNYPDNMHRYYWTHARNKIILNEIVKNNLNKLNLLEIGCGKGIVVNYLRNHHINCYGLEVGEIEVNDTMEYFIQTKKELHQLDPVFLETIDVILLLDVIEHVENPDILIHEIYNHCKKAKYILFTVPACQKLWSNYDTFYGHYRRYDLEMMEELSKKNNFKIIKNRYFFHSLYLPAYLVTKTFKKQRGTNPIPPNTTIKKLIHLLLSKFFQWEYSLSFEKIKGTSILSIIEIQR